MTLGLLTAGYLMWFRALGYSWALQQHLDAVRRQIQADRLVELPPTFCASLPQLLWNGHWLGFGKVNGNLALLSGIDRHVVLFPPVDAPDFYRQLPDHSLNGVRLEVLGRVQFPRPAAAAGPLAVVYGDRFVVMPDVFLKGNYPLILVPQVDGALHVLYPTGGEHFEQLKRRNPRGGVRISSAIKAPDRDTGR